MKDKEAYWGTCKNCKGTGKKRKSLPKKIRLNYKIALEQFENSKGEESAPIRPKGQLQTCSNCKGTGLTRSNTQP